MSRKQISSMDEWLAYAQNQVEEQKRAEKVKLEDSSKYANVPYRSPTAQEYEARWKIEHPEKALELERLKKEMEDYIINLVNKG